MSERFINDEVFAFLFVPFLFLIYLLFCAVILSDTNREEPSKKSQQILTEQELREAAAWEKQREATAVRVGPWVLSFAALGLVITVVSIIVYMRRADDFQAPHREKTAAFLQSLAVNLSDEECEAVDRMRRWTG
jgi:ABC-type Fe3+ transport system permease subunit